MLIRKSSGFKHVWRLQRYQMPYYRMRRRLYSWSTLYITCHCVTRPPSLQFVNTNTCLDTRLFNTDTFSVLKKTNYYTSSSSGIRDVFGTLKLTNFWGIVLDDHWSKKIYSPKMIVDVGCYIHLRWSCFNCYQNFSVARWVVTHSRGSMCEL